MEKQFLKRIGKFLEHVDKYRRGEEQKKFLIQILELETLSVDTIKKLMEEADTEAANDNVAVPLTLQEFNELYALLRDFKYAYAERKYLYSLGYKTKIDQEILGSAGKLVVKGAKL